MNDLVHTDVMCLGKCIRNKLFGKTNADLERVGAGLGEDAVVEAATAAETAAIFVEGEAGADEGVDFLKRDFGRIVMGFEDPEGTGVEVAAGMEAEMVAADFRIDPFQIGAGEDDG